VRQYGHHGSHTGQRRVLGKDAEFATIEPGKLADITVVKGNPLFDIVALSNADVVLKNGVPYRAADLFPVAPPPHNSH
jgi:hypothetical protein